MQVKSSFKIQTYNSSSKRNSPKNEHGRVAINLLILDPASIRVMYYSNEVDIVYVC